MFESGMGSPRCGVARLGIALSPRWSAEKGGQPGCWLGGLTLKVDQKSFWLLGWAPLPQEGGPLALRRIPGGGVPGRALEASAPTNQRAKAS